ncbi:hypothetical protein EON71_00525 [bacterium]|nr:MAG: hypothetical protein EON71_00525 [bacterium]
MHRKDVKKILKKNGIKLPSFGKKTVILCYGIIFLIILFGILLFSIPVYLKILVVWLDIVFFWVCLCYIINKESIFIKNTTTGQISWIMNILFWPYVIISLIIWKTKNSKQQAMSKITQKLYIARYSRNKTEYELKQNTIIVDATTEFSEIILSDGNCKYYNISIMDGSIPSNYYETKNIIDGILEHSRHHEINIIVHCAAGHGRSCMIATIIYCVLYSATPIDAYTYIIKKRPSVSMNIAQWCYIYNYFEIFGGDNFI